MPGLREVLEETYDQINTGEAPEEAVEAAVAAETVPDEAPPDDGGGEDVAADSGRQRDESGRFVAQDTKPEQARTPPPSRPGQGAVAGAVSPPQTALATPPAFKAPQSWKPAQREKWAALPPDVQAEVVRREREIAQAMQQKAEAEKGISPWQDTVRPYEAQIRQLGQEPHAYVGELLKTAHALTYSSEPQKADLLANLVMQFGITPDSLDKALVARFQGRGAPQQQVQQQPMRDPRLDEWFAQQQRETAQQADDTASSFAESHDFFPDVAEEMANILDGWKAAGKQRVSEEDLERAYRMACSGNEDVLAAMEQRKAADAYRTQSGATERARLAASSVESRPAAGVQAQPKGLRATLESRYDELDR